jgi:Kef-type K+ transport system membrane component KefB
MQMIEVVILVPLIMIGVRRAGAWILSKFRNDEDAYFITMLGIMAVAGLLTNLINLPDIFGAFLAGWAVNAAATGHPAKEKLKFFGNSFFIPIFFIVTGFLIDPVAVGQTIFNNFWLVAGMVMSVFLGKGIAAAISGRAFGYTREARLTMWSLTLPHVAATLAVALVGYDTLNAAGDRLLDDEIFNTVLVLLVVTSLLGPVLTELFMPGMIKQETKTAMP